MDPYGVEKNEEIGDMKVADENVEITEKDEDKEILITESKDFGIRETRGRKNISMEQIF